MPKTLTEDELEFFLKEYPELTTEEIIDVLHALNEDANWKQGTSDD